MCWCVCVCVCDVLGVVCDVLVWGVCVWLCVCGVCVCVCVLCVCDCWCVCECVCACAVVAVVKAPLAPLAGFREQGSMLLQDPNTNWLSLKPTQRATQALGYVRPL